MQDHSKAASEVSCERGAVNQCPPTGGTKAGAVVTTLTLKGIHLHCYRQKLPQVFQPQAVSSVFLSAELESVFRKTCVGTARSWVSEQLSTFPPGLTESLENWRGLNGKVRGWRSEFDLRTGKKAGMALNTCIPSSGEAETGGLPGGSLASSQAGWVPDPPEDRVSNNGWHLKNDTQGRPDLTHPLLTLKRSLSPLSLVSQTNKKFKLNKSYQQDALSTLGIYRLYFKIFF